MGRCIVKLEDFYLEWSSVVDAPVTFGMRLDEFREYYRDEYGRDGLRSLEQRMSRVNDHGTSAYQGFTPEDIISSNHAGPKESELTLDEVYKAYCLREPIRDGWVVPTCVEEKDGTIQDVLD